MICRHSEKTGKIEKMSKSKGNVVGPDEIVKEYGTDTLRMYELFVGPPEAESEWSDRSIEGIYRFLKRAWRWAFEAKEKMGGADDAEMLAGVIFSLKTARNGSIRSSSTQSSAR